MASQFYAVLLDSSTCRPYHQDMRMRGLSMCPYCSTWINGTLPGFPSPASPERAQMHEPVEPNTSLVSSAQMPLF